MGRRATAARNPDRPHGHALDPAKDADSWSADVPHQLAAVDTLWRAVDAALRRSGYSADARFDGRIIVTELVTNAVRHGRSLPGGRLTLSYETEPDHRIRVGVTDGGAGTVPRPAPPDPDAAGGRGLLLVSELAADWGVTDGVASRTVHALLAR